MTCNNPSGGGTAQCGRGTCNTVTNVCEGAVCNSCPWNSACAPGDICLDDDVGSGSKWVGSAQGWMFGYPDDNELEPVCDANTGAVRIPIRSPSLATQQRLFSFFIHDVTTNPSIGPSNWVSRFGTVQGGGSNDWSGWGGGTTRSWDLTNGIEETNTWREATVRMSGNLRVEQNTGSVDRVQYIQNIFYRTSGLPTRGCEYQFTCFGQQRGVDLNPTKLSGACDASYSDGYRIDPASVKYVCDEGGWNFKYRMIEVNPGLNQTVTMNAQTWYNVKESDRLYCDVTGAPYACNSTTGPCNCGFNTGPTLSSTTDVTFYTDRNITGGTYIFTGQPNRTYRASAGVKNPFGSDDKTMWSAPFTCSANAVSRSNFDIARCDQGASRFEFKGWACNPLNVNEDVRVRVCRDQPCGNPGSTQVGNDVVASLDRRADPDYASGGAGGSSPAIESDLITNAAYCNGKANGRIGWRLDVTNDTGLRNGVPHLVYAHTLDASGNLSKAFNRYYYPGSDPASFPPPNNASVHPPSSTPVADPTYNSTTPYSYTCAGPPACPSGYILAPTLPFPDDAYNCLITNGVACSTTVTYEIYNAPTAELWVYLPAIGASARLDGGGLPTTGNFPVGDNSTWLLEGYDYIIQLRRPGAAGSCPVILDQVLVRAKKATTSVSGRVYWDSNSNNVYDPLLDTVLYDDVTRPLNVTLTGPTTYSANSSYPAGYTISNVASGTYTLNSTVALYFPPPDPQGRVITTGAAPPPPQNFMVRGYNITGRVCVDGNYDGDCNDVGVDTAYTGPAVSIRIDDNTTLPDGLSPSPYANTRNTSTLAGGNYSILNLAPGPSYWVRLDTATLPAGYTLNPVGPNTNPRVIAPMPQNNIVRDFALTRLFDVTGRVFQDTAGDLCTTLTGVPNGEQVHIERTSSPAGPVTGSPQLTSGGTGTYQYIGANSLQGGVSYRAYFQRVSLPPDYRTIAYRINSGAWQTGSDALFTLTASQTLDFCVSNIKPWYQVESGDVRFAGDLENQVPQTAGVYASLGLNPALFFTSVGDLEIPPTRASSPNDWRIDKEFNYNQPTSVKPSLSYGYFSNLIEKKGVGASTFSCGPGPTNTCDLNPINGLSGIQIVGGTGACNIGTTYTIDRPGQPEIRLNAGNREVIFLINGNARIIKPVRVNPDNVLIIATCGNIEVDPVVGSTDPSGAGVSGTNADLQGIFTAEGNIIVEGAGCPAATNIPDLRLNVGGSLIANADNPFAPGGGGIFDMNRSLCPADDRLYPAVKVFNRFDFVTSLPDEYKTKTSHWKEVQP